MSAICAAYRWDGAPVPVTVPERLLTAMSEYGAEASYWAPDGPESAVALGCIPWRVTPEDAHYRGPVRTADGSVVVVADIRIDNRGELTAELGMDARDAASLCDADLVLAAWLQWQHECPSHIIGEFAFIVWDARTQELFGARDALGHRVLFYHESPHGVELATTAHALTTLAHVGTRLNEQKVAEFLVLLQRSENSFFQGILRLPAAHVLRADRTGVRVQRYWSPAPGRMLQLSSDDEYVEAFNEVFDAAVRSQLRSAGDIGMMASGGLDSSSVAAVAAEQLRAEHRTLTTYHAAPRAGYAGPVRRGFVTDESADVEALARMHPNIELHVRRTDGSSPLKDLETLFRMTGVPPRNPSNVPWVLAIYALAAQGGTRVMLTGAKGNATISQEGLRSLRDSAARGEWGRVWRETRAVARSTGQGRRDVFRRAVVAPLMPRALESAIHWLRRAETKPVWSANLSAINPEFARAMGVEERIRAANRHHRDLHRLSEMDFRLTVLAGGADVYDLYSGFRPWFGIETRDPTADLRVVEFCMAVPGSQYLREGVTRSLIRRAMVGRLPDQIRLRPTYGLQGPDWPEWLPSIRGELRAELDRLDASETAQRCLDLPKMRRLVEHWPDRLTLAHEKDYPLLLLRGITMGRYIRWFEASYS
jgi:asparagine synthase (glutamine-hydrolysing)